MHWGVCLFGTENFFWSGKSWHKFRDFSNVKSKEKESGISHANASSSGPPKINHFYVVHSRDDNEESRDVVIGMLEVFSIDVYAILHPSDTLSCLTFLVDKFFSVLPNILIQAFSINITMDYCVVDRRVITSYPISFPNIVIWVDLVELYVFHFDVILGMD